MKVVISGASGLVGSALCRRLEGRGDEVWKLVRHSGAGDRQIAWQPLEGRIEHEKLEGMDAVVHLSGENIAGFWTTPKKQAIRESRVLSTRTLAEAMGKLRSPPRAWLVASAVGYYGDRTGQVLVETSRSGEGFLPDVCRKWEAATGPAYDRGIRVVNMRFGVVLTADGGALRKMLPAFKLGLAGRIGDGRQYMSWISLPDLLAAIEFLLDRDTLRGPVNLTSPNPVTNYEFTKALGRVLHRPTVLPLPAFLARTVMGEMADETLLASTRVFPARLQEAGFKFQHEEITDALSAVLK